MYMIIMCVHTLFYMPRRERIKGATSLKNNKRSTDTSIGTVLILSVMGLAIIDTQ